MNFNSPVFAVFTAILFVLYYLPVLRGRQVSLLILASIVFYAYGQPWLLILLMISAIINALASYRVLKATERREKLRWAAGGVIVNLLVLGFFKYDRLVADLLGTHDGGLWTVLLAIPLPIGISFYTFHGISLLIDVWKRGDPRGPKPDAPTLTFWRHLHQTLLYLAFFPQLIAGPIVKAHFYFPQIGPKTMAQIDWGTVLRALITGYFLKRVIADNLQDVTFWITYPYFLPLPTVNLVALLFGYSMQIFADFAGYSLIAIGLAALFGYRLPQNFNFPYISQSFSEFWTRWHISLSSFLREYLYYPLGGNRLGAVRTYINLMIVMALGGLWHGAAISYAVWGIWHGLALCLERPFRNTAFFRSPGLIMTSLRMTLVFCVVSAGWLLFKLPHFQDVMVYLGAMGRNFTKGPDIPILILIGMLSAPVIAYHALHLMRRSWPAAVERGRPVLYGAMLAAIALNSGKSDAFIYFQF